MVSERNEEQFYLDYKPKYKIFHELMAKRMRRVLLVSSLYDSFMLEEDGRLSDQIYEEFQNLNLRTLPRITRVASAKEALALLREQEFDVVITMRRLGDIDAFSFGQNVKKIRDIPVILLLTSVVEINYLPEWHNREGIDRVFVWNGDSKIFVAILKHLEDKVNAPHDTEYGEVRVFIFVEDSIRFYSLLLPELYGEIMKQTHELLTEGVNDYQDLLRMRARPKILLAESYEEAMNFYQKYKKNVLGIISDIEYPKNERLDKSAGFQFAKTIKEEAPNTPIVLQSTNKTYQPQAEQLDCFFIDKSSHGMFWDLRQWLLEYVGFGDFIFKLPDGTIVGRAKDVIDFHDQIAQVPIESLIFHGRNDHFSNWLSTRGEFEIAQRLKPRKVSEFTQEELRHFLLRTINEIVLEKTRGIINDFSRENYHPETLFIRLRPGSLGGKGRGIAFLMFLLNTFLLEQEFEEVSIAIPRTIVIGTDAFNKFMEENNLYDIALAEISDQALKERFARARLSESLRDDLKFLLRDLTGPIAVRSSSLLEDSAYQPFAGIFKTYMLPNNSLNIDHRLEDLCTAIKLVYASSFFKLARSYAETVGHTIEESKMAVVIQQAIGKEHNGRFYPEFSGTASSYNFYPFAPYMKPEDRVAHLALGLGKIIVEGGVSLRFCPKYPKINIYPTPDMLLEHSQKEFYAIDLTPQPFDLSSEDPFLIRLDLGDAIKDDVLTNIAGTYDFNSEVLRSGYFGEGAPVITFNRQLKYETFPLAAIISRIMAIGERAMGCSVEIEFAGNIRNDPNENDEFYILQIRPFLPKKEALTGDYKVLDKAKILVQSNQISGNLLRKDIRDIVYVKPDSFDKTQTLEMLDEIDEINDKLYPQGTPFILIGFGRWGSSDRFLGIPAKWPNICGAKVMIEADLEGFQIDFSQGSHFFQNIVSSNIGYFHVQHDKQDHYIDWAWLEEQPIIADKRFVRHVRTKQPLIVKVDGQKGEGLIIKPGDSDQTNRK